MKTRSIAFFIGVLATVLISANIGGLYVYDLDEAKNATCAMEMMERHDLIVPTFNYELRGDKPPLHYYFMIAAYEIFGVNEFSARFFSVIMGVLTVLAVFLFTDRFLSRNAALYSAIALLSSFHFVFQFHMAVPDPYLVFFLTLGWIYFYCSFKDPSWKNTMIMYTSFGLATLAKGPVAIAVPGLSIILFLILSGNFNGKLIKSMKPVPGILLYLIVTLPWFILVHIKTQGLWTRIFFVENNIDRYTSTMDRHGAVFLVVPLIVILGMLPFSTVIFQSFAAGWKKRKGNDMLFYSIVVSLTIMTFFSFSKTKLPNYTVPAYPFLAILVGWYISELLAGKFSKPLLKITFWIYLAVAFSIPVVLYIILGQEPVFSGLKNNSWYFLLLPFGGILSILCIYYKKLLNAFLALSLSWIIMSLMFYYWLFPKIDKLNPVARALPLIDTSRPVAVYGIYNSAFSFYIKKPFTPLSSTGQLEQYVKTHPGSYVISRKSKMDDLEKAGHLRLIAEDKDIFEIPTTVILQVESR